VVVVVQGASADAVVRVVRVVRVAPSTAVARAVVVPGSRATAWSCWDAATATSGGDASSGGPRDRGR
jgi:hypothetical protein